jgi:hypothetical protein
LILYSFSQFGIRASCFCVFCRSSRSLQRTMEPQTAPSAQVVGQEFVKQYYTMLNAAPEHLHRWENPATVIYIAGC